MNTRKYEGLTSTSRATASRELIELAKLGLVLTVGAGRSTRYYINLDGWVPAAVVERRRPRLPHDRERPRSAGP